MTKTETIQVKGQVKGQVKDKYWVIVPAAGVGQRMQQAIPKQYLEIAGKSIIALTLQRLLDISTFERITVMIAEADSHWADLALAVHPAIVSQIGGARRSESVLNGLISLKSEVAEQDWILVHDAARPCVRSDDIESLLARLKTHPVGGILATPISDTLKLSESGKLSSHGAVIKHTVSRENIWAALTPQLFRYGILLEALQKAVKENLPITDEASAVELLGLKVLLVEGHRDNIKITRQEDLLLAETYLRQQQVIQ